jgi:hypothetical protein
MMTSPTDVPGIGDPLNQPIHGPVPDGRPPWRDNAYVCFWDTRRNLVGVLHVSTSPNTEGRRARFSLALDGRTIELIEPLEPGTFRSASTSYALDDRVVVNGSRISGRLELKPRFSVADYTAGQVIPPLVPGEPQHHYQQALSVVGSLTIDGRVVDVDGAGFRDRTWGYRDESAHIDEYISFMAVFPSFAVTALRFHDTDGGNRVEGFLLTDGGVTKVASIGVTRDAAGLLAEGELGLADGGPLVLRVTERKGGFWVPMGAERRGPTLSAYDEFSALSSADGEHGHGFIEHAALRRLF